MMVLVPVMPSPAHHPPHPCPAAASLPPPPPPPPRATLPSLLPPPPLLSPRCRHRVTLPLLHMMMPVMITSLAHRPAHPRPATPPRPPLPPPPALLPPLPPLPPLPAPLPPQLPPPPPPHHSAADDGPLSPHHPRHISAAARPRCPPRRSPTPPIRVTAAEHAEHDQLRLRLQQSHQHRRVDCQ